MFCLCAGLRRLCEPALIRDLSVSVRGWRRKRVLDGCRRFLKALRVLRFESRSRRGDILGQFWPDGFGEVDDIVVTSSHQENSAMTTTTRLGSAAAESEAPAAEPPPSSTLISAELVDEEANKELMRQFITQEIQNNLQLGNHSSSNTPNSVLPIAVVATSSSEHQEGNGGTTAAAAGGGSSINANTGCLVRVLLVIVILLAIVVAIVVYVLLSDANAGNPPSSNDVVTGSGDDIGSPTTLSPKPTTTTADDDEDDTTNANVLKYGDVVYFELMYDTSKEYNAKNATTNTNIPSSLWLSGGRGRNNEYVLTRDLLHDEYEHSEPIIGHFQWILHRNSTSSSTGSSATTPNDAAATTTTASCVQYGSSQVWFQVKYPNHRWLSGGRGNDNIYVSTRDVVNDEFEIDKSFHYPWIVRSNSSTGTSSVNDPKYGQCINYKDVAYLQVANYPNRWLTGGRDEEIVSSELNDVYVRPMEQVYSKDIHNDNNNHISDGASLHNLYYQWKLHSCVFDC